ncbi:DUF3017 domain-containing protein, partial [Embleya sp. NPDC059213]|uniref:DUF3017 domain-containing protein n=1 Tax=Embleya sp. NPDC059213 TaxID=3346771 RepID=UPI0036C90045
MATARGRRKDGRKKEPGTYLPEGGASPAGPGPLREWPAMVVFGCLIAALLTAALDGFRIAAVLIAGTFLIAAILRLFVADVGVLAVRSRFTDVEFGVDRCGLLGTERGDDVEPVQLLVAFAGAV